MAKYLVTGGRQRPARFVRRDEWHSFELAILAELDTDTGRVRVLVEYETPPGARPDVEPSILFKSGSWDGENLLLCTQTEVLSVSPAGAILDQWSLTCFNDVHHVARIDGQMHIVSTGLDALIVMSDAGEVTALHSAVDTPTWARFDRNIDYRKIATTKPHHAHPNYVFAYDGEVWITRFEQRDARSLSGRVLTLGGAAIHDGVPKADGVWFTHVSGAVSVRGNRNQTWDLNTFGSGEEPLGWCRGIALEPDHVLVGFSRLRPTLFKQNLGWLRGALSRPEPEPTRVAAYDLERGKLLQSWNLEEYGVSCVFSILRVPS